MSYPIPPIDPKVLDRAAEIIRDALLVENVDAIKKCFEIHGTHEWFWHIHDDEIEKMKKENPSGRPFFMSPHMTLGMGIRNLLRAEGLLDKETPTGNWDDYYIEAIEHALGLTPTMSLGEYIKVREGKKHD